MDNNYRICTSPGGLKRPGSLFSPRFFVAFVLLHSLLANFFVGCTAAASSKNPKQPEDDEFAEFEDFDDDAVGGGTESPGTGDDDSAKTPPSSTAPPPTATPALREQSPGDSDDLDGVVELDDVEEDDFGADSTPGAGVKLSPSGAKRSGAAADDGGVKQLRFTDVPAHLRNNWSNFQVELLMLFGLVVYLTSYVVGKSKNHKLATSWFESNRDLLLSNFEVVGDDGTTPEVQKNILMKESDNVYSVWCTGRAACQGALFQLKFLKRQDIASLVMQIFKPQYDKIIVRFNLNSEDMDSCILALGNRKTVTKLVKDHTDLSQYCTEKKNADRLGLPESFCLFSEIAEAANSVIDAKVLSVVQKYEHLIDYIHVSDQFSGLKSNEGEAQTKLPETSRVAIFCFNIPGKLNAFEQSIEECKPLLPFAFYCLEKIRRFRLSREAKAKCDKNRLAAQESYLKQTHAQRQEAAQVRREEKARERKERVLAEEDPEKQRRLEKMEQRRELKKKQPRVKQLKIKAG